jgi:hypothetical protein
MAVLILKPKRAAHKQRTVAVAGDARLLHDLGHRALAGPDAKHTPSGADKPKSVRDRVCECLVSSRGGQA